MADERPAAALPIVWDGGALALDVSLDGAQVEYDACMRIEVRDADDRPWLGTSIGGGGGGELHQTASFTVGEQDWYPAVRTPETSVRTSIQPWKNAAPASVQRTIVPVPSSDSRSAPRSPSPSGTTANGFSLARASKICRRTTLSSRSRAHTHSSSSPASALQPS